MSTVKEQIRDYCRAQGLSDSVTSAVMAQAEKESSYRPALCESARICNIGMTKEQYIQAVESGSYEWDRDRIGFGLFQWTNKDRKHDLLAYAKKKKKSLTDVNMQMGYVFVEFKQRQYKLSVETKNLISLVMPGLPDMANVWELMQNAPDTELGAFVVGFSLCMDFEKPERKITSSPSRGARAAELFRELKQS